jgi:hypothetical protein
MNMDLADLQRRTAARNDARTDRFGDFTITYPVQFAAEIPQLRDTLTRAKSLYQAAGVTLRNVGVNYRNPRYRTNFYKDGVIFVGRVDYPGQTRNFVTIVHELAHLLHYQQVAGGFGNVEVKAKWADAKEGDPWWPSTDYVHKNHLEWFAEMVQTLVLHPNRLEPGVQQFFKDVIQ